MKRNQLFWAMGLHIVVSGLLFGMLWQVTCATPPTITDGATRTGTVVVDTNAPMIGVNTQLTLPLSSALYLPLVHSPASQVVIAAAHIDSVISGEGDEAVLLWNIGMAAQPLAGWQLATATRAATFPSTSTLTLAAGAWLWCTAEATTYRATFGSTPGCEWRGDDPTVPDLVGSLSLANSGGRLQLYAADGQLVDTLLYGDEDRPATGWQGPAAQLYTRGDVPKEGQIWQRKRAPQSGLPLDRDTADDWSSDLADLAWGRQVFMPGWLALESIPARSAPGIQATATITVAIGPEGLYQPLAAFIAQTQHTLDLSLYTIEHRALAELLAAVAQRGVHIRLLLEGSPPGGISDFQKWCVATIVAAGGDVRYLAVRDDAPKGYRTRYRYLHAKYGISDGRLVFNGTENLSYDAMPLPQAVPVGGRRGFYLFTDAAPVVVGLQTLFAYDWAPERFFDLYPFTAAHPKYGGPPVDFSWPEAPTYAVTAAPFAQPLATTGTAHFALVSAPENAARPDQAILTLLNRAGSGDAIAMTQLYEHKNWGDATSNPIADPNPRLQALIAAAQRGAHVQLLLDRYFDDSASVRNNQATVDYLNALAAVEGLDLTARLGNPTLGGIHAKLLLLRIGTEEWSAIGSLNGSEVSHKLNREVVVLTDAPAVYTRLHEVFTWDWAQP